MTAISHLHLSAPRAQSEAPHARNDLDQRWVLLLATAGWLAMATIAVLLLTGAWSPLDQTAGDTQQQNPAESPALGRPSIPQPRQPQPDSPQPRRTHAPQPRTPRNGD